MTAFIQSKLFQPHIFTDSMVIDNVREFMLSSELKKKYKKRITDNAFEVTTVPIQTDVIRQNSIVENTQINPNKDFIKPKQKDTLFWCLYIAHHGYNEYVELRNNYGMKQIEIQEKIGQHIRKNMVLLKNVNTRITKAVAQEILSELLTDSKKTSFPVLYAYAIYYNMNLILMHPSRKYYIEILSDSILEDVPMYVLQKGEYEQYSINETPITEEEYVQICTNKFKLDSYIRPLKAIGNYKADELRDIAEKIELDMTIKRTKPELYHAVTEKLKWY